MTGWIIFGSVVLLFVLVVLVVLFILLILVVLLVLVILLVYPISIQIFTISNNIHFMVSSFLHMNRLLL